MLALLLFNLLSSVYADSENGWPGVPQCGEQTVLKSYFDQYLQAKQQLEVEAVKGVSGNLDHLYIEFRGEKVILKTAHAWPLYLRAAPNGTVDLVDLPLNWEEFHPYKNKDGSCLICNTKDKFWCKTDFVCSPPYIPGIDDIPRKMAGHRVFKSAHGTYLRANDNSTMTVDLAHWALEGEHWLVETRGHRVVLKSGRSGKYLRVNVNGTIDVHEEDHRDSTWRPVQNADRTWRLQSDDGKWLSAGDDNTVTTVEYHGPWENFILEDWY